MSTARPSSSGITTAYTDGVTGFLLTVLSPCCEEPLAVTNAVKNAGSGPLWC